MSFKPIKPSLKNIREVNIDIFAIQIEEIQKILRDNMFIAQADYKRHAN